MISSFSVNTQTPSQSKRSNGHERRHVAETGLGHASPPADQRVEMTEELETKGKYEHRRCYTSLCGDA